MSERPDKKIVSAETQDALDYIGLMKQECNTLGGNDSEFDRLEQLARALKDGSIDSASAKEQAYNIRYGKIER